MLYAHEELVDLAFDVGISKHLGFILLEKLNVV